MLAYQGRGVFSQGRRGTLDQYIDPQVLFTCNGSRPIDAQLYCRHNLSFSSANMRKSCSAPALGHATHQPHFKQVNIKLLLSLSVSLRLTSRQPCVSPILVSSVPTVIIISGTIACLRSSPSVCTSYSIHRLGRGGIKFRLRLYKFPSDFPREKRFMHMPT